MTAIRKQAEPRLTADKMLGVAGGSLAAASIGFGLYMNTHGPAPGAFGASHDFTVFAQLAPHDRRVARPTENRAARPATTDDALDTTATASIPKGPQAPATGDGPDAMVAENGVIPSVTLEAAVADVATIAIDGRTRTVRIGDDVPGAGEVLAIEPGRHPRVKTSRGLILSGRPDED